MVPARSLPAVLLAALVLAPLVARADVGPIDDTCTVERRCKETGVECRYVNSDPQLGDLACEEDARKRGLERACSRGGGTVGNHIYCPKGQGRSAGCNTDADAHGRPAALAGLAAALLVAFAARPRRRPVTGPRQP